MTIAQALRRIAKLKGEYKELLDRCRLGHLPDEAAAGFRF